MKRLIKDQTIKFRVTKDDLKFARESAGNDGLDVSKWGYKKLFESNNFLKGNLSVLTKRQKEELREVFKEEAEILFVEVNVQERVIKMARGSLKGKNHKIDMKPIIKYLDLLEDTIYKKYTKKQLEPVSDCLERIHDLRNVEGVLDLQRTSYIVKLIEEGKSPEDIHKLLEKYDKNNNKSEGNSKKALEWDEKDIDEWENKHDNV